MKLICLLILAFLLYLIQRRIYQKHWISHVSATLSFSKQEAAIGENVILYETIKNEKWLPLPKCNVKFKTSRSFTFENQENAQITDYYYRNDLFTLLSYQTTKRSLTFTPNQRGYFTIMDMDLTSSDLFLRQNFAQHLQTNTHLYVYPKLLSEIALPTGLADFESQFLTNKGIYYDPFSYYGSRTYLPGDPFHSINWKMSAARQTLYTNLAQPVTHHEVLILCNLHPFYDNGKDQLLDYMISILATLIHHYLKQNILLHVFTNGKDIITGENIQFTDIEKMSQFTSVLKGLARIDTNKSEDDFDSIIPNYKRFNGRLCPLIIVSNDRTQTLMDQYLLMRNHFSKSCFILPEYSLVPVRFDIPDKLSWEVPYE